MEKVKLERKFILERGSSKIDLPDPGETMTPSQVMDFYSATYPELVNSRMERPRFSDDGQSVYSFKTTLGTKG